MSGRMCAARPLQECGCGLGTAGLQLGRTSLASPLLQVLCLFPAIWVNEDCRP